MEEHYTEAEGSTPVQAEGSEWTASPGHQLRRRISAVHDRAQGGAGLDTESLHDVEAAPLLCAGLTTFNALRHSGAVPGDLVAVEGIGGLGHLGIQFAHKFGYRVAAIGP